MNEYLKKINDNKPREGNYYVIPEEMEIRYNSNRVLITNYYNGFYRDDFEKFKWSSEGSLKEFYNEVSVFSFSAGCIYGIGSGWNGMSISEVVNELYDPWQWYELKIFPKDLKIEGEKVGNIRPRDFKFYGSIFG